jgi:hypothetical protein
MYIALHVKYLLICPILIKHEFFQQIFKKHLIIRFHENLSSGN